MNPALRLGHRLLSGRVAAGPIRRLSLPAAKDDGGDEPEMIAQRSLPADYDPATFDPSANPRGPPSDRVWCLVDDVAALTLAEVADLSAILMRRLGVKEAPVIGVTRPGASTTGPAVPGGVGAAKEEKAEKKVFELRLDSYEAASKIKVIKEVRVFTDLGLKEAKELVEKTPAVIKRGVSKEEAEQIIEKMKAAGAKVVME